LVQIFVEIEYLYDCLKPFMSLLTGYNWIINFFFYFSLQLFLGIVICMMSLHMYFAPPNMLLDMPLTVKSDEEEKLIEVSVDRRTRS
jgi:solute carrier family 35 (UDP-sugar transporter), member A1/2/3